VALMVKSIIIGEISAAVKIHAGVDEK